MKTLYNIQFARALAATLVVYAHIAIPKATFGHFGVDIFFVISGFIMTMICHDAPQNFFLRRVVRIVPLYWLATLAVFLISYVKPELLNSTTANFGNFLKSIFFIPYTKENGTIHPMLDVGWTLNYEMYFYASIAVALLLVPHRRAAVTASIGLASICVLINLVAAFFPPTSLMVATWVQFYGSSQIFEFIAGVGVFYLSRSDVALKMGTIPNLAAAVLCVVFMAATQLTSTHLQGGIFVKRVLPSAIFVLSMLLLERKNVVITRLTLFGDASYAVYLINQFVVDGMQKILAKILHLSIYSPIVCIVALVGSVAVGIVIFLSIEKPMHNFFRSVLERRPKRPSLVEAPVRA